MTNNWFKGKNIALLGACSLIGSHLADALLASGVNSLVIADDLSAGKKSNIRSAIAKGANFIQADLRDYNNVYDAVYDANIVFHLAAQHGGRGYVGTHSVELYDNLALDTTIFRACADVGVDKVIFSSSACAYPTKIQQDPSEILRLTEGLIDYNDVQQADGPYGTEKLLGEMILDAYIEQGSFKGCSTRSFTVYGPLIRESHAIAALIAKTMIKQEPFEIWGSDGNQLRNWTFVKDNVAGAMLAAEHLDRGAINIGVEDRLTPMIAAETIWNYVGWKPKEIKFLTDMPVGPLNRVADATKLYDLGWRPKYTFQQGVETTVDWYYNTHDVETVRKTLEKSLTDK